MTNCTHKKPSYVGEVVVFSSPHHSGVLLVDRAESDAYGRLIWSAVAHETATYKDAIYHHENIAGGRDDTSRPQFTDDVVF